MKQVKEKSISYQKHFECINCPKCGKFCDPVSCWSCGTQTWRVKEIESFKLFVNPCGTLRIEGYILDNMKTFDLDLSLEHKDLKEDLKEKHETTCGFEFYFNKEDQALILDQACLVRDI